MDYITQADVEAYLGITLTDSGANFFNTMNPLMQEVVDQYCNRTWNFSNPVTEYFDAIQDTASPHVTDTFFVSNPNISTTPANPSFPQAGGIVSLKIQDVPWDLRYVYNYKTHVKLWIKPVSVLLVNPLGYRAVELVYNSDAAGALPKPIKLAMTEWMARKIQTAPDAGKEVVDVQTGTVRARYVQDDKGGIPNFVKMILDNYRLTPLDHF